MRDPLPAGGDNQAFSAARMGNDSAAADCARFESGMHRQETGVEWLPETKVLTNAHATLKLPGWIAAQLARFARGDSNPVGVKQ